LERGDVNLHVQDGHKDVGERKDTNKVEELTPKEKKRRGKFRPSKKTMKTATLA
jgi:hypothetical protein